ncbi:MAG: type II toxin-antitoxin system Phd/YefM family antitoxin [Acidimicrobiia bacterium]
MESIGVREIRQNVSAYLRRVQAGESFEVTDRGRPIAVLISNREAVVTAVSEVIEGLVASGAYPSLDAAVSEGVDALAYRVRAELIDRAIVDGYRRVPQEPDPWAEEAARRTFREMDPW